VKNILKNCKKSRFKKIHKNQKVSKSIKKYQKVFTLFILLNPAACWRTCLPHRR